jgi:hypothetical protein
MSPFSGEGGDLSSSLPCTCMCHVSHTASIVAALKCFLPCFSVFEQAFISSSQSSTGRFHLAFSIVTLLHPPGVHPVRDKWGPVLERSPSRAWALGETPPRASTITLDSAREKKQSWQSGMNRPRVRLSSTQILQQTVKVPATCGVS